MKTPPPAKRNVSVAVRLDTTKSFHRACLRGMLAYSRQYRPAWSIASDVANRLWVVRPDEVPEITADFLVGIFTPEELETLTERGVRCVNLLTHTTDGKVPVIASDDRAVGVMAASHFADQEIGHAVYYGIVRQQKHSQLRFEGFADAMEARTGIRPEAIQLDLDEADPSSAAGRDRHTRSILSTVSTVIASRGTPVGVFAFSDDLGATVVEACHAAGLSVPDDVAVIGVDNDDLICEMTAPALSSIRQNGEGIGFKAAEVLDALVEGKRPADIVNLLPPLSVVIRPSSDTIAIKDPLVARAVKIIRSTVADSLNVTELARTLNVSRRLLAKRFREALDRTPHDEIVGTRIRLAKRLLANTDMTNLAIALDCGFSGEHRFEQNFRQFTGMTPYAYRKQVRPESASKSAPRRRVESNS